MPNAGDYRSFETVGGPIFLMRGADGVLRAFANYCRHRGSLLVDGEGCTKRLICPYHAWSYMLDGSLWGCPDMKDAEGFDRVENGLVPVRMEVVERLRVLHVQRRRAVAARVARRPAASAWRRTGSTRCGARGR